MRQYILRRALPGCSQRCRRGGVVVQQGEGVREERAGWCSWLNWCDNQLGIRLSDKNTIRSRRFGHSPMIAVDIGPMLAQAAECAPSWSPARAIEALTRIHSCVEGSKIDWDSGAGEKWCRLLLKGSVLGAVSTLIPVVLLRSPVSPALQTVLDEAGLILIPVSSWDAQSLSVEPQAALSAFARERWSDAVDPTCFSGSELWWMTV